MKHLPHHQTQSGSKDLVFLTKLIEAGEDEGGYRHVFSAGTDRRGAPVYRTGVQEGKRGHSGGTWRPILMKRCIPPQEGDME